MKIKLRINPFFETVRTETHMLILDNITPRQIKIRSHPLLHAIFDELLTLPSEADFQNSVERRLCGNVDTTYFMKLFDKLDDLNVIDRFDEEPEFLTPQEFSRFRYQFDWFSLHETSNHSRFDLFKNIRQSTVALVGIGGVGSNVAAMLAASGIGRLIIIDPDVVEESNLVRQLFYKRKHVGNTKKVDALEEYIADFTTYTTIKKVDNYIKTPNEIEEAIQGANLVIQTADYPAVILNRNINQVCIKRNIPYLYSFHKGIGPFFIPGETSCFYCFENFAMKESHGMHEVIVKDLSTRPRRSLPSFVTGPWLQAHHIFTEAFHYLAGTHETVLKNRMLHIKSAFETQFIDIPKIQNCACGRYNDK